MKSIEQPGFVYILHAEGTNRFKIGYSADPEKRCQSVSQQSPFSIVLIHSYPSDNAYRDEQKLHNMFSNRRVHGEWFCFDSIEHIKVLIDEFFEIKSLNKSTKPIPISSRHLYSGDEVNDQSQRPKPKKREKPEYPDLSDEQIRIVKFVEKQGGECKLNDILKGMTITVNGERWTKEKYTHAIHSIKNKGYLNLRVERETIWISLLRFEQVDKSSQQESPENNSNPDDINRRKFEAITSYCQRKGETTVRKIQQGKLLSDEYKLDSNFIKYALNMLSEQGLITLDKSSEDWIIESFAGNPLSASFPDFDIWKLRQKPKKSDNPKDKFMQILTFCEGIGSTSVREVQRSSVGYNLSSDVIKYAFEWLENNGYGTVKTEQTGGTTRVSFTPDSCDSKLENKPELNQIINGVELYPEWLSIYELAKQDGSILAREVYRSALGQRLKLNKATTRQIFDKLTEAKLGTVTEVSGSCIFTPDLSYKQSKTQAHELSRSS